MKKNVTLFLFTLVLAGCGSPDGVSFSEAPSCTVNQTTSGVVVRCPDGSGAIVSNGPQGTQGIQGQQGVAGSTGPAGAQGIAGTSVVMVQFCSASFVASYPSTFPESGLCIGGQLYGVYSANGGFLSVLPPGAYSSDGINSSCNFTIATNCSITQN
jgi:hypothetical protein